jgi:VanZ family protein
MHRPVGALHSCLRRRSGWGRWWQWLVAWGPALLIMAVIFWFSSQPQPFVIETRWLNLLVAKGGHVAGYGLLAVSVRWALWCWFPAARRADRIAWIVTVVYAVSDETHQHFVPGRNGNLWDVLIDGTGAVAGLWIWQRWVNWVRTGPLNAHRSDC